MKVISFGVIGLLVGNFVAPVIVWLYLLPTSVGECAMYGAAVYAGIIGAVFGAPVGIIIGVWKVSSIPPK